MDSLNDLQRSLTKSEPKPVYFFYGPEESLIKKAIKLVRSSVEKSSTTPMSWSVFDLAQTDFGEFFTDIRTVSFFGERRGVLAYNLLLEKNRGTGEYCLDGKSQKLLIEYVSNPSPDVVLVLAADKIDSRLKFWKGLKKVSPVSMAFEMKEHVQKKAVAQKLAESGFSFTGEAKEWMVERFYNRYSRIDSEIEKLGVYMGDKNRVEISDLEDCMSTPPLKSIFKLTDALVGRKVDETLQVLKSLRTHGETYLMVLPMIARHFRILMIIKSCMAQGLSENETMKKCEVHPYFFNNYRNQASRFEIGYLKKSLYILSRADLRIRGSGVNSWKTLDEEIISHMVNS